MCFESTYLRESLAACVSGKNAVLLNLMFVIKFKFTKKKLRDFLLQLFTKIFLCDSTKSFQYFN